MLEFLGAGPNVAFVVALVTMLLIGVLEAIGLGSSALGHDLGADGDLHWLDWLGLGRLPLLMTLVLFLAAFGTIGLVGQQFALDHLGGLLSPAIAVPGAAVAAWPVTALLGRVAARIIPRDETSAIGIDQLVGLTGEIVVGRATRGSPAKARVRDFHGQSHYVMVEPDDAALAFAEGEQVRLCRLENSIFRAIPSGRADFSDWISR
ncbi:YqiJ family protein [Sphingomonas naphthae]|uniref:YqiJ family protein n=1 Tax=Sphingomonas naphthae TaxID=1813468 RepID=A0ABY7TKQ9_9SPHN|nr:YqiJ family protein [Sphingomonas naphthae]WCT73551.1 YqiJ family protein [Sphingomonas naphthae]